MHESTVQSDIKNLFSLLLGIQETKEDEYINMTNTYNQEACDYLRHNILENAREMDKPAKDGMIRHFLEAMEDEKELLAKMQRRGSIAFPQKETVFEHVQDALKENVAYLYDINRDTKAGQQQLDQKLSAIRKQFGISEQNYLR